MIHQSTHELMCSELLSANDVLMEPQLGRLPSRGDAKIDSYIYSAPMDTVTGYRLASEMIENNEYAVVSRFLGGKHGLESEEYCAALHELGESDLAFFATSASSDRIEALLRYCEEHSLTLNVSVDVAHGDSIFAHAATEVLSASKYVRNVMSGSLCTPRGAIRAALAGCTHLRVGVGPGAACTTRLMTGVGYPQLSAIYRIHMALKDEYNLPEDFDIQIAHPQEVTDKYVMRNMVKIISDGGIKKPGDANKYLGIGADGIMMGSRFSKTEESPGWIEKTHKSYSVINPEIAPKAMYKSYRGQASAEFQDDQFGRPNRCPEGAASPEFEWDGTTVESVIEEFRGGLASAISYLGLESSEEMDPDNVTFFKITPSTYMEGTPHGI